MKVLLLGATGNVGSRLLPALLSHNHEVVAYVRNPSKLTGNPTSVVRGSATDVNDIKAAILNNNCDAVVNAAGIAGVFTRTVEFPAIFAAVVKAAVEAGEERGRPLRAWFLSGFGLLDVPGTKYQMMDYVPIYRDHRTNYKTLTTLAAGKLDWSLFCANMMTPGAVQPYRVTADVPPEWSSMLKWVPLIGTYLNVLAQIGSYSASLEGTTEFIAADLEANTGRFVGKRVGYKVTKS